MTIPPYAYNVLLLLCIFGVSFSKSQNIGFSVELIHPDSSSSPLYNPTETRFQQISNVVNHSLNRAKYISHLFYVSHNNTPKTTLTPNIGAGYIISYSIGSPPFQSYGYFDMQYDLILFQCKPHRPSLNQTSSIFDPSKSSTYKNIPCTSAKCNYVHKANCTSHDCKYHLGDNSIYSQGDLSVDTLTLSSTNGTPISFPRTVIACEHKAGGGFPLNGKVSGIVSLGGGPLSLVSQLGSSIDGKISYCLVPLFSHSNTSSKLNFGNSAVVSGTDTVSTPLKQLNPIIITLEAFSVGNKTIKLEQASFGSDKKPNATIDISLSLTILPEDVLSRLESVVASLIKLKRISDPTHQLNLCYQSKLSQLEVPIITAHFSGADLQLKAHNTFIPVDQKVVCFAFTSFGYFGIPMLGSVAQQNFLVGYDLQKKIVSFKPTDCTMSN